MMLFNKQTGFTLVELAIVLVVIGILVGAGAAMIGPMVKRSQLNEGRQAVSAAVESVVGFAILNKRLPREENPDGLEFSNTVSKIKDPWGKELQYIYDESLSEVEDICNESVTETNITVERHDRDPPREIKNVAFIVLSGGPNYNNQTAGTGPVSDSSTIEVPAAGTVVDNYPDDVNKAEPYDDIVEIVTLYQLKGRMGCMVYGVGPGPDPEHCPDGIEIWNNSLWSMCVEIDGTGNLLQIGNDINVAPSAANITIMDFDCSGWFPVASYTYSALAAKAGSDCRVGTEELKTVKR